MKKSNYYMAMPAKLKDVFKEIEENPPKIAGFRISYIKELIHLICTRRLDNGYSQLKMIILKKIIPAADQYVNFLLKREIIERDGQYIPNGKAYGYRINPIYDSKFIREPLSDAKLLWRLKKLKRNRPVYIKNYTIDPAALKFAEIHYSDPLSLQYAISAITLILNEEKFYTVDNTAGRLHTNISNLPKELRSYIVTYNGQRLTANIDIKNSQPYFSTLIFTAPGKIAEFAKGKNLHMILKSLHIQDSEDVKRYINLVCEGNFYEYLVKEFNKRGHKYTRDQVKDSVMKILFAPNCHNFKARKIFAELFPNVHEVFCKIRGNAKGDHFTSYKRFAILLQSIEAHTVLNIILRRVNTEYPHIITFTVHDSVLTTSAPEIVHKIMMDELTKFCGRAPVLKVERIERKEENKEENKEEREVL